MPIIALNIYGILVIPGEFEEIAIRWWSLLCRVGQMVWCRLAWCLRKTQRDVQKPDWLWNSSTFKCLEWEWDGKWCLFWAFTFVTTLLKLGFHSGGLQAGHYHRYWYTLTPAPVFWSICLDSWHSDKSSSYCIIALVCFGVARNEKLYAGCLCFWYSLPGKWRQKLLAGDSTGHSWYPARL